MSEPVVKKEFDPDKKREFVQFTVKKDAGSLFHIPGDAQVFKLTYDFNCMCDAEIVSGQNLLRAMTGRMTSLELRALLYGLLRVYHPLVELKEAGELMTIDRNSVMDALTEILSMEEEKEEEPKEVPADIAAARAQLANQPLEEPEALQVG